MFLNSNPICSFLIWRKPQIDFWKFPLYLEHCLYSFTESRNFWLFLLLWNSIYNNIIMNKKFYFISFNMWTFYILFLYHYLGLTVWSEITLKRENMHILFPDLQAMDLVSQYIHINRKITKRIQTYPINTPRSCKKWCSFFSF